MLAGPPQRIENQQDSFPIPLKKVDFIVIAQPLGSSCHSIRALAVAAISRHLFWRVKRNFLLKVFSCYWKPPRERDFGVLANFGKRVQQGLGGPGVCDQSGDQFGARRPDDRGDFALSDGEADDQLCGQ